jgi:hypothetical protein
MSPAQPPPEPDTSAERVRQFEDRLIGLLVQAMASERGLVLEDAEPPVLEAIEREALAALHGNAVRIVHAASERITAETLSAVLREQKRRRLGFLRCFAAILLGFAAAAAGAAGLAARALRPPPAMAAGIEPVPAAEPALPVAAAPVEAAAQEPPAPPAAAAPPPPAETRAEDPPPPPEARAEAPPPAAALPAAAPPVAEPVGPRRTGTITTRAGGRTNIRSDPSTTARVVAVVGPGTVLGVFGEPRNGWLPVGRDAPLGWMRQTTLDR